VFYLSFSRLLDIYLGGCNLREIRLPSELRQKRNSYHEKAELLAQLSLLRLYSSSIKLRNNRITLNWLESNNSRKILIS
jgi:hypothetical protein